MSTRTENLPAPIRKLLEDRFASELPLPMLPDTVAQVMAADDDTDCDASSLAEIIQKDPSLSGHVLSLSNSAAYAPKEPILSLQQAISRLGISTICEVSIAIALKGRVFQVPGYGVRLREIWMHSTTTGIYSKKITELLGLDFAGAFLCGLLHDFGRPIVMQTMVDIVKEKTQRPIPRPIMEAAMEEFHEPVGGLIIDRWEFPDLMSNVIAKHHDRARLESGTGEGMVVSVADLMSKWALSDQSPEQFPREDPLLGALEIDDDMVTELLLLRGEALRIAEELV